MQYYALYSNLNWSPAKSLYSYSFADLYQILSIEYFQSIKRILKKCFYIEPNSPLCRKGREPICSNPKSLHRFSEFKQHASIKIMDLGGPHGDFINKMHF